MLKYKTLQHLTLNFINVLARLQKIYTCSYLTRVICLLIFSSHAIKILFQEFDTYPSIIMINARGWIWLYTACARICTCVNKYILKLEYSWHSNLYSLRAELFKQELWSFPHNSLYPASKMRLCLAAWLCMCRNMYATCPLSMNVLSNIYDLHQYQRNLNTLSLIILYLDLELVL